ncbi:MAG: glycosyltransferase family 4 protein [Candidatus Omnitrophica bacterium]|nr:glycosyltransferase family 4 protein [Candidatus Omnitrophota bacterium]
MQTQSVEFYRCIKSQNQVMLIAWGHSQVFLPFFIVFAFLKACFLLIQKKADVIQLGDLVLSPVGVLLNRIFHIPVLSISHGRDSAFGNKLYDKFVLSSAKKLDRIICVSSNMKTRLKARGINEEKLTVIPNGINADSFKDKIVDRQEALNILQNEFALQLEGKKIIFSICRLVPKKGIKEFIDKVFVEIITKCQNSVFLIAGCGPEMPLIAESIKKNHWENKIFLLGQIAYNSLAFHALFMAGDVFVMPNRQVSGDAEGFGIAILEASMHGRPVVAFDVDGISEAVIDGKNGILIKANDNSSFAESVFLFLSDEKKNRDFGQMARKYTEEHFNWNSIVKRYMEQYKISVS